MAQSMEGAAEICPTHFRGLASRAETLLVTGNCMKIPGDSMAARVALVTGAASGIGRARSGLWAAAAARRRRRDYVVAHSGGNGRWVGIRQRTALESRCTIEINLTGSFLTRRAAVPAGRGVGGGALVLIGVVNGTRRVSNLGATAKAAAKAGAAADEAGAGAGQDLGRFDVSGRDPYGDFGRITAGRCGQRALPGKLPGGRGIPDGRPRGGNAAGGRDGVVFVIGLVVAHERNRGVCGWGAGVDPG